MAKRRMNHDGSVFQWREGKWRAQITVEGQRLSFNGKSQKECLDWIRKTQTQVERGLTYEGSKISLKDFLTEWLVSKRGSIRKKTHDHYKRDIEIRIIPGLGNLKVSELKPVHVQRLLDNELIDGLGIRSVRHLYGTIRQALNHAARLGIISINPALAAQPPKQPRREFRILDESQIQILLNVAREYQPDIYALYFLALNTGMRQSELLGLKWIDLEWEAKSLYVHRQVQFEKGRGVILRGLKTKASKRVIKLGDQTLQILRDHKVSQADQSFANREKWIENDMIFPTFLGTLSYSSVLQKKFVRLLDKADLPKIRFHDLRHTAASLMLKHSIPVIVVSRRLGHSRPSITLDVYGHLIPGMQDEAARLMDEVMTPILVSIAPKLHQKQEPSKKEGSEL